METSGETNEKLEEPLITESLGSSEKVKTDGKLAAEDEHNKVGVKRHQKEPVMGGEKREKRLVKRPARYVDEK
jgi:hypothetical protein